MAPSARCIALDLIGMGKSDKPDIEYRFFDHVSYVEGFIAKLGLEHVTLVVHDWGSKLGLYYAMRHERNVEGVAFLGSMFMPVARWRAIPADFRDTLRAWRTPVVGWDLIVNRNVFLNEVLPGAIVRRLTDEETRHYQRPFEDPRSRKVLWRWPREIPIEGEPADVAAAMQAVKQWLARTDVPMLLFHATLGGLGQAPMVRWLRRHVRNFAAVHLGRGLHFIQEDYPHEIGADLARWHSSF